LKNLAKTREENPTKKSEKKKQTNRKCKEVKPLSSHRSTREQEIGTTENVARAKQGVSNEVGLLEL